MFILPIISLVFFAFSGLKLYIRHNVAKGHQGILDKLLLETAMGNPNMPGNGGSFIQHAQVN
jgi:hypothetical protein